MAETWIINETPLLTAINSSIRFYSNGAEFSFFYAAYTAGEYAQVTKIVYTPFPPAPEPTPGALDIVVYDVYITEARWTDQAYRTVTFETAPTGDLLTWLQANAVKQEPQEPLVTDDLTGWTWVGNDVLAGSSIGRLELSFVSNNRDFVVFDLDIAIYVIYQKVKIFYRSYTEAPVTAYDDLDGAGWTDQANRIIKITGGTDATNTDLIKWLQDNGTLTRAHITLDLSTIGLPEGTHSIQMKLSDDGVTKADSELSNAVVYTVFQTYTITPMLTNVVAGGGNPTTIQIGSTATLIFAANPGYEFPDSVTVHGASYTWDKLTGTLVLLDPNENITVAIVGVQREWSGTDLTGTVWRIPSDRASANMTNTTYYSNILTKRISGGDSPTAITIYTWYDGFSLSCFKVNARVGSTSIYALGTSAVWDSNTTDYGRPISSPPTFPLSGSGNNISTRDRYWMGAKTSTGLYTSSSDYYYIDRGRTKSYLNTYFLFAQENDTISFLGGEDVQNPNLIAFMRANATLESW